MTAGTLIEKLREVAETGFLPDGDGVNLPTKMWLEELLRQHQAEQPTASAEVVKLIAECRDALHAASSYMAPSGFSGEYAKRQVQEQIERCETAISTLQSIPIAEQGKAIPTCPNQWWVCNVCECQHESKRDALDCNHAEPKGRIWKAMRPGLPAASVASSEPSDSAIDPDRHTFEGLAAVADSVEGRRREESVVDSKGFQDRVRNAIYGIGLDSKTSVRRAEFITDLLRPYLRAAEPSRCTHGVWPYDHCYECEKEAKSVERESREMTEEEKREAARVLFEKHIQQTGFRHPRMGMRPARWEELGEDGQRVWTDNLSALLEHFELRRKA